MIFNLKQNSLVARTGLYSFISFGFGMLILVILFSFIANIQIMKLIETENDDHIYSHVNQLDHTILRYVKDINLKAQSPTLINAVMNPRESKYYLPDYINGLTLESLKGEFLLLTFDGIIIENGEEETEYNYFSHFKDSEDIDPVYIDSLNRVIFISRVMYQGYTEGYLLYEVDFESIFDSNVHLFELHRDDNRSFFALYKGDIVANYGKEQINSITSTYSLSMLPLDLQVVTNKSVIINPVRSILIQIVLISFVMIFLLTIFTSFITSRNMTRPLSVLEKGIIKAGNGEVQSIPRIKREYLEIKFIRQSFNSILRAIKEKNDDLEFSNKELKRINDNLHQTQNQLVQSEKMASIGQLAAGVAHEINNPTGFVTTNLHTMTEYLSIFKSILDKNDELIKLLKETDDTAISQTIKSINLIKKEEDYDFVYEDSRELLAESIDGVGRIKDIVNGLRNFAREDNQEKILANINTAIEDALRLTWNELKYKCNVVKKIEDIPDFPCRIDQLTQVIVNLLVNAAHAITDKGEIVITTRLNDNNIEVSISDTGAGIPKENMDRLFDPFFTTKEVGQGTGLGLAISYGIVEEHGGTILVESEIDKGTTFIIVLPISGVTEVKE